MGTVVGAQTRLIDSAEARGKLILRDDDGTEWECIELNHRGGKTYRLIRCKPVNHPRRRRDSSPSTWTTSAMHTCSSGSVAGSQTQVIGARTARDKSRCANCRRSTVARIQFHFRRYLPCLRAGDCSSLLALSGQSLTCFPISRCALIRRSRADGCVSRAGTSDVDCTRFRRSGKSAARNICANCSRLRRTVRVKADC